MEALDFCVDPDQDFQYIFKKFHVVLLFSTTPPYLQEERHKSSEKMKKL